MSAPQNSSSLAANPQVVATVHSPGSLKQALRLKRGDVDFLELRVDAFGANANQLLAATSKLQIPLIITVRHPVEGGANRLGFAERERLFATFLPCATMIDVEVRSLKRLAHTIETAREVVVKLVCSDHHFRSMPTAARLKHAIQAADRAGAHVCKIAARTERLAQLRILLELFTKRQPIALSVMGMGTFGKISRLLFAQAGSVLNYGYLDKPNASGQWEATLLKKRIAELSER